MNVFIEMPATKNSLANRKPVCGIGINDTDYIVCPVINGKRVWCPYYRAWNSMLVRCYSKKYQATRPTYLDCLVVKEWLMFSVFKEWMKTQDWQNKELDKDILIIGNKEYSPKACIFVSHVINSLLTDSAASRGHLPQGVSLHNRVGKYRASCSADGKQQHLGYFTTIAEAEITYLIFKSGLVERIANDNMGPIKSALLRHSSVLKNKAECIK